MDSFISSCFVTGSGAVLVHACGSWSSSIKAIEEKSRALVRPRVCDLELAGVLGKTLGNVCVTV